MHSKQPALETVSELFPSDTDASEVHRKLVPDYRHIDLDATAAKTSRENAWGNEVSMNC